jgi:hypothetical protein
MSSVVRLEKKIKDQYENKLRAVGIDGLYKYVIGQGILNKKITTHPELVLLDHSNYFFSLYRQKNDEINYLIGRCLRRASHKLYRELLKSSENDDYPINARFLNVVK